MRRSVAKSRGWGRAEHPAAAWAARWTILFALACPAALAGVEIPPDYVPPPELRGPLAFEIDPAASEIAIGIVSTLHDVEGRTSGIRGTVTGSIARLAEDAEVHLTIDAASITTGFWLRDRDMWSNQLEVKKYPTIEFESKGLKEIARSDTEKLAGAFVLAGRLTLHGVTREIELSVEARYEEGRLHATGATSLLISDYSIEDPSILFLEVEDEVTIEFRVVAKPMAAPAASLPEPAAP